MRISILALFLCSSTIAFCQSTASGFQTPDKLWPLPAQPSAAVGQLSPAWQPSGAGTEKAGTTFFEWDQTQIDPKTSFKLILPRTTEPFANAFVAKNDSAIPKLFKPWPNINAEPIPTQWPNARAEKIPTQWPNLKFLRIKPQTNPATGTAALK